MREVKKNLLTPPNFAYAPLYLATSSLYKIPSCGLCQHMNLHVLFCLWFSWFRTSTERQLWQPGFLVMVHIHSLTSLQILVTGRLIPACSPPHSCLLFYLLGLASLAVLHIPGTLNPSRGFPAGRPEPLLLTRTPKWGSQICNLTASQGVRQGVPPSHWAVFTVPFHGDGLSIWWNFRCSFFISKIFQGFPYTQPTIESNRSPGRLWLWDHETQKPECWEWDLYNQRYLRVVCMNSLETEVLSRDGGRSKREQKLSRLG